MSDNGARETASVGLRFIIPFLGEGDGFVVEVQVDGEPVPLSKLAEFGKADRPEAGVFEVQLDVVKPPRPTATVALFRRGGKWYTDEEWRIPTEADMERSRFPSRPGDLVTPHCMIYSPDFRRIDGGPVLVSTQEPWGYSALLVPGAADAAGVS